MKRLLVPFSFVFLAVAHSPSLLGQTPPGEVEIDHAFRQLHQGFRAKAAASLGAESFPDVPTTSAWLSKSFLARSVSEVFNRSNVRMRADIDRQGLPDPPMQMIRTGRMNCSPRRGCRSNCIDDCTKKVFGVKVTDWLCVAGCKLEKDACEVLKGSEKAACEGVKVLFAEKKVGEFSFSALSAKGHGEVKGLTLSLADDLSRAELSGALGASLVLRGFLQFRPEPLVQVGTVCAQISGEVPGVRVAAPDQSLTLEADLDLRETPDGISLDLSFNELEPDVKVIGNPFIDFVLKNPKNFIECSLPTLAGLLLDTFQGEFPIDQKVKIPGGRPFPVGAVAVLDGVTLTPQLTTTAVGMVEKVPQPKVAAVGGATSTGQGDLP